jgi:hypothetical protein
VDEHIVRERWDDPSDRVVERVRQLSFGVLSQQVGPADGADEEEVSGEEANRAWGAGVVVVYEERDVLGRVSRRVDRPESYGTDPQLIAVSELPVRERDFVALARVVGRKVQLRPGSPGEA